VQGWADNLVHVLRYQLADLFVYQRPQISLAICRSQKGAIEALQEELTDL
jgi:hypothetical protein